MKLQSLSSVVLFVIFLFYARPVAGLDVAVVLARASEEANETKGTSTNHPETIKHINDLRNKLIRVKVAEWPSSGERFSEINVSKVLESILPESAPKSELGITPGDPLRFRWTDDNLQFVQCRIGVYSDSTEAQLRLLSCIEENTAVRVEPKEFPSAVLAQDEGSISAAYRNVFLRLSFGPMEFARKAGRRPNEIEAKRLQTLLAKMYAVLRNESVSSPSQVASHVELRTEKLIAKGEKGKIIFSIPKMLHDARLAITCLDSRDIVVSDKSNPHSGEQVWTIQAKRSGKIRFSIEATNPATGEITKEELSFDVIDK